MRPNLWHIGDYANLISFSMVYIVLTSYVMPLMSSFLWTTRKDQTQIRDNHLGALLESETGSGLKICLVSYTIPFRIEPAYEKDPKSLKTMRVKRRKRPQHCRCFRCAKALISFKNKLQNTVGQANVDYFIRYIGLLF